MPKSKTQRPSRARTVGPALRPPTADPAGASDPSPSGAAKQAPERRATAETMATRQREISVSEFFTKNRHLLGFDNPAKALLTTVKEAVDNALDACEEAGILPSIRVEIVELQAAAATKDGEVARGP